MKPPETDLVAAMRADLREAWQAIYRKNPSERLYVFGLYTTEEAAYFSPFACGDLGLQQVAQRYVANGHYPNTDSAAAGLKWSIADSPYQDKLPCARIQAELSKRSDPTSTKLPATAAAREIRARLNAAAAALTSLDNEGLFARHADNRGLILLIEAGDREEEFVLKWAKKLNPPPIYRAFASLFEQPAVGRWTEFGTKKVYETTQLAATADRRLVATASEYVGCVFDVVANKQLLCRPIPNKNAYWPIQGVTISGGGEKLAFVSGSDSRTSFLTLLDGPGWKRQADVKLPKQPLSFVGSPDAQWYAIGCEDSLVHIYDGSGGPIKELSGHGHWPRTLSLSADGLHLASIDEKSGLRVWNTTNWSLAAHASEAKGTHVSFDPTGRRIATVRRWGRLAKDPSGEILKIWSFPELTNVAEHRLPGFEFEAAAFSPDGQTLACGIENVDHGLHHEVILLDAESGQVRQRLRGPFDWCEDFLFLPARNAIAIAARGHTRRPLVLWELGEPSETRASSDAGNDTAFSDNPPLDSH
ncbi:MAG: hypothetical protein JWN40_2736 [Phycisphaerales bacterium]|nr:hypothetical protein [Phycisphaerales bacterium]